MLIQIPQKGEYIGWHKSGLAMTFVMSVYGPASRTDLIVSMSQVQRVGPGIQSLRDDAIGESLKTPINS